MTYVVRPISDRTPFKGKHRRSPFDSTWTATRQLLLRETRELRARDLVLEIDVREADIRLDGELRANARPSSPAVRLAFDSKHGPLTYAGDAFSTWQDNIRAIALGLEALRKFARYEINSGTEQYAGFKALPAGRAMPSSHMTRTEAAELLERVAIGNEGATREWTVQRILDDQAHAREVWREARKVAHPDRRGGDHSVWNQVEQAAAVLGVAR
jgi:hypothetical protein